jgi:hypothetical protein
MEHIKVRDKAGRTMAQAVSRRPLTAEARVRSRVSPCGGQSGAGTGFSPRVLRFSRQFHSTGAPLQGKIKKLIIIFITGLHNKPQLCGAPIASAAGPFTKKKKVSFTATKKYTKIPVFLISAQNVNF